MAAELNTSDFISDTDNENANSMNATQDLYPDLQDVRSSSPVVNPDPATEGDAGKEQPGPADYDAGREMPTLSRSEEGRRGSSLTEQEPTQNEAVGETNTPSNYRYMEEYDSPAMGTHMS